MMLHSKGVFGRNSSKSNPFGGKCKNVRFWSCEPQKQILARNRVFRRICIKIRACVLAVGDLKCQRIGRVNFGPDAPRNRACAETKPLVRSW